MSPHALIEAHRGLAMLAVLATVGWAAAALFTPLASGGLGRLHRLSYVAAMATTGLAGLTGLVVVVLGTAPAALYPWFGLVAIIGHGVAGARARRALVVGRRDTVVAGVAVQGLLLLAAYGVMTVKPF
ncbi:hypothetical protein EYW49_11030 [Siculibacillus lacustris]|uniref:Uncharacterized protein n=1 Tax=Siculibacillus lacustris TaxID=1549641 RepID=A0A4Q9VRU3_9HYPH|nr:hypothetical protein [Siculibacillus lacustris]TBW37632.1 hypothetical protein EYW49_11030 [Siculibacillus lacustris]